MHNLEEIKKRFLKNDLSMRLGCIASDLARLSSFSQMPNNQEVIRDLIEESKFFIEWTVPKIPFGIQKELVNIQIQLALLSLSKRQRKITALADRWSRKLLELSGLLRK